MNEINYLKKANKNMLTCWSVIVVVLILSYILEFFKGNRSLSYLLVFSGFTIVPFLIPMYTYLKQIISQKTIKYLAIVGYLIFYSFALLTGNSKGNFVYIIPMASALIIYTDVLLIDITFSYSFALNIVSIICYVQKNKLTSENVTFFEIQMACIVLTWLFLRKSMKIVKANNDKLFKLNNEFYKDDLTGAYNRKFFTKNIESLFDNDLKYGINMAYIDIDNFKNFNTKYGHDFGDEVLSHFSLLIKQNIAELDDTYFIRMGGDEFAIINSSMKESDFKNILLNIINDVKNKTVSSDIHKNISITISIGLANSKSDICTDYLDLLRKADSRLYKAKNNGKNQLWQ